VPAKINKNNTTALNAVFLSIKGLFAKEHNKYQLPPSFFNNVDLEGL
jgi:hypothetical protein